MTTSLKALCEEVLLKAKDADPLPWEIQPQQNAQERNRTYLALAVNSAETLAQALLDKMAEIERKDRALEAMRFALDRINDTPNLNGPEADRALPHAKLAWMLAARALAKVEEILGKGNG